MLKNLEKATLQKYFENIKCFFGDDVILNLDTVNAALRKLHAKLRAMILMMIIPKESEIHNLENEHVTMTTVRFWHCINLFEILVRVSS